VLSHAVTAVGLSRLAGGDTEHAVLLSTLPDGQGEVSVVRRAGRFDPKSGVRFAIGDDVYTLTPSRLIDAGDDFHWASYRVSRAN
jgi:hypothetical protein